MGHPNKSAGEERDRLQDFGDRIEIVELSGFVSRDSFSLDATQEFLRDVIELRSEFFHCGICADHFAGLSTMQSYLRGD